MYIWRQRLINPTDILYKFNGRCNMVKAKTTAINFRIQTIRSETQACDRCSYIIFLATGSEVVLLGAVQPALSN
jgi:hypothetical protein